MTENENIGFGIIGCGMISNWHADAILKIKGAYIVGASDVNENSRKNFSEKYNVQAFGSIKASILHMSGHYGIPEMRYLIRRAKSHTLPDMIL